MLKLVVDNTRNEDFIPEDLENMDYLQALEALHDAEDNADLTRYVSSGREIFLREVVGRSNRA